MQLRDSCTFLVRCCIGLTRVYRGDCASFAVFACVPAGMAACPAHAVAHLTDGMIDNLVSFLVDMKKGEPTTCGNIIGEHQIGVGLVLDLALALKADKRLLCVGLPPFYLSMRFMPFSTTFVLRMAGRCVPLLAIVIARLCLPVQTRSGRRLAKLWLLASGRTI